MDTKFDILNDVLPAIDPALLDYQSWVNVGFALKDGGYTAQDWDDWSRRDADRYHPGECYKKWGSMQSSGVTLGTLVQYARDQGWRPKDTSPDLAFGWDDPLPRAGVVIEDPDHIETHPLPQPSEPWHPGRELARYLELLFGPDEIVGYVTSTWYSDDKKKYMPDKGNYTRTAAELTAALAKHGDDLGAALGDYREEAGAWIRFNPLDGQGIRNENVTEYRYALVESDAIPVEQQYAIYRSLELPARVLVHSGGKSLHAIVHIGAGSYDEYRKRVQYLYRICEQNGLKIDGQNKNPSRLSRMPGATRNGQKQYIVAENLGKANFDEWKEYIESVNDDLPDPQPLSEMWDAMPELAPALIGGVLRQGHKLLLAGPSKAGKSFALLELAIAIAEGGSWMGFPCAQGRVLYVNLELDPASCWHRLKDTYRAMGVTPAHTNAIDVWNLRGSAVPMDKLAPKLIRRAQKKNYLAVILDPIYKVITGDENSADQMAAFCNQFDLICAKLGCAVIYCHHHSKGAQGQKASMDRASGSGVFARDPDALLDMIQLPVSAELKKQQGDRAAIRAICAMLDRYATVTRWQEYFSQDDLLTYTRMASESRKYLPEARYAELEAAMRKAREMSDRRTAWRIEGTLREFAPFDPVDLWFDYPVHIKDEDGVLGDVKAEGQRGWLHQQGMDAKAQKAERDRTNRRVLLEGLIRRWGGIGKVDGQTLYDYFAEPENNPDGKGIKGVKKDSVRKWLKEIGLRVDPGNGKIAEIGSAEGSADG